MKKSRNTARFLAAAIVSAIIALPFAGCVSDDCLDNRNSMPLAALMSSATGKQISVDSLTVFGIGAPADSLILDSAKNVSQIYLPFDIEADKTVFVIKYLQKAISADRFNDTISFIYTRVPYFTSISCGVSMRYHIEEISHTNHLIDSVTCPTGVIDNVPGENIFIYFRTSE